MDNFLSMFSREDDPQYNTRTLLRFRLTCYPHSVPVPPCHSRHLRSPNLSVDALVEDHRGISGLSRLVQGCLDGKLPEPRSRAFAAVQEALAKAAAENVPKDRRAPVRAFLPTFRKLCSSSLCIG